MKRDPADVTLAEIQSAWPGMQEASQVFIRQFGPAFTGTKQFHVGTDIAGAAAIAGRLVLEDSGVDLKRSKPGVVLLWESHSSEDAIFRFMRADGSRFGLDAEFRTAKSIPAQYESVLETNVMTDRLRAPLLSACDGKRVDARLRPFVAAHTAMVLLYSGVKDRSIPEDVGRLIAVMGVMNGTRTIPNR